MIPLTSQSNGNKVNANRFIAIKDSGNPVSVKIRSELFTRLLELCIKDLMHNLEFDDRIILLKQMYHKELLNKARNLAYYIISANKKHDVDTEEIKRVESEIYEIISNIYYVLDQSDVDNGVQAIFENCISCIDGKEVR